MFIINHLLRSNWLLFALFLLGGVCRIFYYCLGDNTVSRDSVLYIHIIDLLAQSKDFHDELLIGYRTLPPLTFFLSLLTIKALNVDAFSAGIIVNIVCSSLLIPVVYLIGCEISRDCFFRLGGALLVAMSPVLIKLASVVQRESAYLLMGGGVILMILHWSKVPQYRYVLGCGVFAVLSIYSRLEGFEFFVLLPLLILSIGRWHLHLGWKKVAWQVLLIFISAGCMFWVCEFCVFRSGFLDYRRISSHLADHIELGKKQ